MTLEAAFKKKTLVFIREDLLPGSLTFHMNASYNQGILDTLILYRDRWACLEFKKSATAKKRPNQDWHRDRLDNMSFAAFIYPENSEEVLYALHRSLTARR